MKTGMKHPPRVVKVRYHAQENLQTFLSRYPVPGGVEANRLVWDFGVLSRLNVPICDLVFPPAGSTLWSIRAL